MSVTAMNPAINSAMKPLAVQAKASPDDAGTLKRAIPEGHSRSIGRSLATGAVVTGAFVALGALTPSRITIYQALAKTAGARAAVGAIGIAGSVATIAAINYTNHNGSLHGGKQWNSPWESMGIAGGIAAAGAGASMLAVGQPKAALGAAGLAFIGGGLIGGIYHALNRPEH